MDPKSSSVPTKRAWYQNKIVVSVLALVVLLGAGVGYFSQSSDLFKGSLFVNGRSQDFNDCKLEYKYGFSVVSNSGGNDVTNEPVRNIACQFKNFEIISDSKPSIFSLAVDPQTGAISRDGGVVGNSNAWEDFDGRIEENINKYASYIRNNTKRITVRAESIDGETSTTNLTVAQTLLPKRSFGLDAFLNYNDTTLRRLPGQQLIFPNLIDLELQNLPRLNAFSDQDFRTGFTSQYVIYPPLPEGLEFDPTAEGNAKISGEIKPFTVPVGCNQHVVIRVADGVKSSTGRVGTRVIGQNKAVNVCIEEGNGPEIQLSERGDVTVRSRNYKLSAFVSDDLSLYEVSYRLNSNPSVDLVSETTKAKILNGEEPLRSFAINTDLELGNGRNRIVIFAKDVEGNINMRTIHVTAPTATIDSNKLFNKLRSTNKTTVPSTQSVIEESTTERQDFTPRRSLQDVFSN